MAILMREHNLLFIMNPRTGCTAMGKMMIEDMGGEYLPTADILGEDGKVHIQQKHTTLPELQSLNLLSQDEMAALCKFTSVRNPFDSLVSLWSKKRFKYSGARARDPNSIANKLPGYSDDLEFILEHTFSEWIIHTFGRRKNPTVNSKHQQGTDHFLRFESLRSDFAELLKAQGVAGNFQIPLHNQTRYRTSDYQNYYTQKARKVIEKGFAEELDRLGYAF